MRAGIFPTSYAALGIALTFLAACTQQNASLDSEADNNISAWDKRIRDVVKERSIIAQYFYRLALEQYHTQDYEQAEKNIHKALAAKPDFPEAKSLAARLAAALGKEILLVKEELPPPPPVRLHGWIL